MDGGGDGKPSLVLYNLLHISITRSIFFSHLLLSISLLLPDRGLSDLFEAIPHASLRYHCIVMAVVLLVHLL